MKGLGTIYRKELSGMFNSAIAYVFLVVFLLLMALLFVESVFRVRLAEMRYYFEILPWVFAILMPAVTMRIWAEEHRQGTIELLMTLPLKLSTVVLGKFLACASFLVVTLSGTATIPGILILAWDAETGPIVSGYLGSAGLGFLFIAVGMYVSALTRDQIVAFILALVVCMLFVLVGMPWVSNPVDGWLPGLGTFLRYQFGAGDHLEPFEKGIVAFSDLLYFASMAGMFLGLNVLALASRTNVPDRPRYVIGGALTAVIGVFLALNVNEARLGRLDLTENRVYTITDAGKRILSRLRAPVKVEYYVTNVEKMPSNMKQLERDVTDLLRELSVASGRFEYKVIDPASDPALAPKLADKGIHPLRVIIYEKDQEQAVRVYTAMKISYLDRDEEVIPSVRPDGLGNLEFDILSRVHRLTLERKPKVAFFAKMPQVDPYMRMMGQMPRDEYSQAAEALRQQKYDVIRVSLNGSEPIPDDADALIVMDPQQVNERQMWEINRFVRSGRPALIAVQTYKLNYDSVLREGYITVENQQWKMDTLLNAWGVTADDAILMDANFYTLSYRGLPLDIPAHAKITPETMDPTGGTMAGIGEMLYMWGSPLKFNEGRLNSSGLTKRVLATSGDRTWLLRGIGLISENEVVRNRPKFDGRQPVMAWVDGTFPDAFAGRPAPQWPEGGGAEAKPLDKPHPSKVVFCGSAFMFSDGLVNVGNNLAVLMNTMDILTHGGDLAKIRAKTRTPRAIGDLTPNQALFYRSSMVGGVPLLLLLVGIVRLVIRRRGREVYQKGVRT
jgi:ABC-type transport system involved in multi-copper enzyme maturation permease subunit